MNRYATRFKDAADVARFLRGNAKSLLDRVIGWQSALYESGEPEWIANALVQSLYS